MTIEILYPGYLLYGDRGNVEFLEKTFPEAEFKYTNVKDEPWFVRHTPDFIYMGPMSEANLETVTEKLLPYRKRLAELIENGTYFLIISTALEIFGQYIELTDGTRLKTLDLLPFYTHRDMNDRHDCVVMGTFENLKIMGYDARFTEQYGNDSMPFLQVERGFGFNRKSKLEGVHYKNFFGTNLMGPILIMNQPLIKYFRRQLAGDETIPYENYMKEAYETRLDKFLHSNEIINQDPHAKPR